MQFRCYFSIVLISLLCGSKAFARNIICPSHSLIHRAVIHKTHVFEERSDGHNSYLFESIPVKDRRGVWWYTFVVVGAWVDSKESGMHIAQTALNFTGNLWVGPGAISEHFWECFYQPMVIKEQPALQVFTIAPSFDTDQDDDQMLHAAYLAASQYMGPRQASERPTN